MNPGDSDRPLRAALERARDAGAIGPATIDEVLSHSSLFVAGLDGIVGRVVDLGSGGGVPGLVIAWRRPDLRMVLVDRRAKRTDLLRRACLSMGIEGRVEVLTGDAASVSGVVDATVARLFGSPEVTARTAAALVRSGGVVVVSDAPDGHAWETTALATWSRSIIELPGVGGRVVRFVAP